MNDRVVWKNGRMHYLGLVGSVFDSAAIGALHG